MKTAFKFIFAAVMGLCAATSHAADNDAPVNYIPEFGGVARVRWEMSTDDATVGDNRFAVRNARLWLKGKIARPIEYYLRVDLCNQGSMQFLDGYIRFNTTDWLKLQAGQFRIPFGLDAFRGPGTYIFANRSFIGRDLANNRAVGVQAMTTVPNTPLSVNFGIFSAHSITNHYVWSKNMTYAAKAVLDLKPIAITAGVQTIQPENVRINMADLGVTLKAGRFTAEAEYMYKHYTNAAFRACHAYNIWADYALPLRRGLFNCLSFQARFEGNTPHSSGKGDSMGLLIEDQPRRQRLTGGATLSYVHKRVRCDLVLDYEKYFYHDNYTPSYDRGDKLMAELVVVF